MIYVHRLKDLNPKNADIESIQLIREIKRNSHIPLTPEKLRSHLNNLFISEADKSSIKNAIDYIEPAVNELKGLAAKNDPLYESINLKRAISMLESLSSPIINNIAYSEEICFVKEQIIIEASNLINSIPKLRTPDEKAGFNKRLTGIFEKLLRNNEFYFNSVHIVGEGEIETITSLDESIKNRFIFHTLIEEELKKLKFDFIRQRIPLAELQKADEIARKIAAIKTGVEAAYRHNMNIVNIAVILYSYVKMISGK